MESRRGFTLIEIIAVVIIIGVLALIIVPSVSGYIGNSRSTAYNSHEVSMEEAAKEMTIEVISGNDNFSLPRRGNSTNVSLQSLIDKEFIKELQDPQTGKKCNEEMSYVIIKNIDDNNYDYKACLYCGAYVTDSDECQERVVSDPTGPICGAITGESSEWTNNSRTITVACSDPESNCKKSKYSKTFNTTTDTTEISIYNNANVETKCPVNVRVDKTPPTCELKIEDGTAESTGWLSGRNVVVKMIAKGDGEHQSGLSTYGMGTSSKKPNYNAKTEYEILNVSGTTTIFGYVKDNAGNEGICYKTVTTGLERPVFDVRYGYQIYPEKERFTTSNVSITGTNKLKTTSTNPTITFNHMDKYTNVTAMIIDLGTDVTAPGDWKLTVGGTTYSAEGESTRRLRFNIEVEPGLSSVSSSSTYTLKLGKDNNKEYTINRIEIEQKTGTLLSRYNVAVNLRTRKQVVRTTEWSWNDGTNWDTKYYATFDITSSEKTGIAKIRNDIPLTSFGVDYSISKGDNVKPTITLSRSTDEWTNQDVILTAKMQDTGTGIIGYMWSTSDNLGYYDSGWQYYDNPTTQERSITYSASKNGTYYFYAKDDAGNVEKKSITVSKIDKLVPTCSAITGNGNQAVLSCSDPAATTDNGQSKLVKYYFGTSSNPSDSSFIAITEGTSFSKTESVSSANTYYLSVKDKAGNRSASVSDTYYTITFDGNGATTAGTASGIIRYKAKSISTITNPIREYTVSFDKNGTNATTTTTSKTATYTFNGWYTATSSGSKVASNATTPALQASVSGYTNASKEWTKTSGATLYAQWTSASVTLPSISKTSYNCKWNTNKSGTGTDYAGGSSYTPTSNITLYAHCTPSTVKVTFNANTGECETKDKTITIGSQYGDLPTATKCGHTFLGWYTDKTDGDKVESTTVYNGTSNHTLYAHYSNNRYLYDAVKCANGRNIYTDEHQDSMNAALSTEDIYYPLTVNQHANLVFNGICWRVFRTTDTGGIKMIYNGPVNNGKCPAYYSRSANIGSTTYSDVKGLGWFNYMYNRTKSLETKWLSSSVTFYPLEGNAIIGTGFTRNGNNSNSLTGTITVSINELLNNYSSYENKYYICEDYSQTTCTDFQLGLLVDANLIGNVRITNPIKQYTFGGGFTYSGGKYYLTDTITQWKLSSDEVMDTLKNRHYMCPDGSSSCTTLRYLYKHFGMGFNYIELNGGETPMGIFNDVFYANDVNTYSSNAKTYIENWYRDNMMSVDKYVDDVIFCSNRSYDFTTFDPNYNRIPPGNLSYYDIYFSKGTFKCDRDTDRFSISNPKARLSYKVGLLSTIENYTCANNAYRVTMSPSDLEGAASLYNAHYTPGTTISMQPVIALKKGSKYSSGDGSSDNPYIFETY